MAATFKLYMVLLGCRPKGRLTEQHDIFFGIGTSLPNMVKEMYAFWPDAGRLHADAWREITKIGGYTISVVPKGEAVPSDKSLFFINLGGYRPGEFEEYHYKTLIVAKSIGMAIREAKKSAFFKHYDIGGTGVSHIDEKYALDVDDMHKVEDILAPHLKEQFSISISQTHEGTDDELHIGYLKLKV